MPRRIVTEYVLTLTCPDARGIVFSLCRGILAIGGNILEQAQFTDPELELLCLRVRFECPVQDDEQVRQAVEAQLDSFFPVMTLRRRNTKRRLLVMVSRLDHCLADLLYRKELGELEIDIPLVVSNHDDCRALVEGHGIPFVHVPVDAESKPESERLLRELVVEHRVDFIVLARYMQVLSHESCVALAGRIVNIHHSFLPGFKGARPYHQAHARGVKLIGATAHFVTDDLDEGPIIEQDVQRVTHAHTTADLVEIGRDVERRVLASAVRAVAEDRVFQTGQRTVVLT